MALDPKIQAFIRQQTDEIMRATLGDEGARALKVKIHLNFICRQCPFCVYDREDGKIEFCEPPSPSECMREHEKKFIEEGLVQPR